MPSLFSRARTASTPSKHTNQSSPQHSPYLCLAIPTPPPPSSDEFALMRARTACPPTRPTASSNSSPRRCPRTTTCHLLLRVLLSPAWDAVLGLPDAAVRRARAHGRRYALRILCPRIGRPPSGRRAPRARLPSCTPSLVHAFLATCQDSNSSSRNGSQQAEKRWAEEVRFTAAHELRVCLRWGLSGVVRRVEGGREVRRLLSWA
ncbi:hypothetical protein C8R44DRAFT_894924 [Mycena epipterygia]|nr:hypothetical protein C8R44DRAFT_894924 [Mycena epipterygia]